MRRVCLALFSSLALFLGCQLYAQGDKKDVDKKEPSQPEAKPKEIDFKKEVWPLLEAKCLRCHNEKQKKGGSALHTREAMLKGGVSGPSVVPGNAEKSLLYDLVRNFEMPPKKEKQKLTVDELKILQAWINAGAKFETK